MAIDSQLLPQGADVHIHCPGFSRILSIPHGGEQLLPCKGDTRLRKEQMEKFLASVWNTEYLGETRTVDMHIRTLRQKLGSYGNIIETVRNVGYRLESNYDK